MEISELFVFVSFGKVWFSKFKFFFGNNQNFWPCEIFAKKFGKKFGKLSSEKVWILTKILRQLKQFQIKLCKIWNLMKKILFLSQKTLILCQNVQKKVWKSSEIVPFWTFRKLQKMTLNSNSKTDLKLRLKVWNAGP